jgi:hypothetical protein
MELILMSTTGTATLLLLQFIDFLRREHVTVLACRIRAVRHLLMVSGTTTVTMPVAATY